MCVTITGPNKTDIVVEERQEKYKISIDCANNCTYKGIDEHRYGKCECKKINNNYNFLRHSVFKSFLSSNFDIFEPDSFF